MAALNPHMPVMHAQLWAVMPHPVAALNPHMPVMHAPPSHMPYGP